MSTTFPTNGEYERKWYVVDATDIPIGRVSSHVAKVLMGKLNPAYTPHTDMGDHVIIINAEKVKFSGDKVNRKKYRRHSMRPGSLKEVTVKDMLVKHPTRPLELAVKGMLPKTKLGRAMFRKLKVYEGANHDHAAQKPEPLTIK